MSGVHPEQLRAMARLLVDTGDLTPAGARMLDKLAQQVQERAEAREQAASQRQA